MCVVLNCSVNGSATIAMSSNTGSTFYPGCTWIITVLFSVSIALFVMTTLHFQHVINMHKEQILELNERLTWLEEQQNKEGTVKSSFSKEVKAS